jgi:hypothetical protein
LLFFPDNFELCNGFQVLRAASRTLGLNERWQIEAAAPETKDLDFDGVAKQILITASACDLPKEIKGTYTGFQREVQAHAEGSY